MLRFNHFTSEQKKNRLKPAKLWAWRRFRPTITPEEPKKAAMKVLKGGSSEVLVENLLSGALGAITGKRELPEDALKLIEEE